jgi:hypothetical protein
LHRAAEGGRLLALGGRTGNMMPSLTFSGNDEGALSIRWSREPRWKRQRRVRGGCSATLLSDPHGSLE